MTYPTFECARFHKDAVPNATTLHAELGEVDSIAGLCVHGASQDNDPVALVQTLQLVRSLRIEFYGVLAQRDRAFLSAPSRQPIGQSTVLLFRAIGGEDTNESAFLLNSGIRVQHLTASGWIDVPHTRYGFRLGVGKYNFGVVEVAQLSDVENPCQITAISYLQALKTYEDLMSPGSDNMSGWVANTQQEFSE